MIGLCAWLVKVFLFTYLKKRPKKFQQIILLLVKGFNTELYATMNYDLSRLGIWLISFLISSAEWSSFLKCVTVGIHSKSKKPKKF